MHTIEKVNKSTINIPLTFNKVDCGTKDPYVFSAKLPIKSANLVLCGLDYYYMSGGPLLDSKVSLDPEITDYTNGNKR